MENDIENKTMKLSKYIDIELNEFYDKLTLLHKLINNQVRDSSDNNALISSVCIEIVNLRNNIHNIRMNIK